ncbi:hypothetical protein TNCV_182211 [Trichonephila clavipes]|nr:hypothetical protein TNCV_182211 [Trichonephila clavipes]
MVSIPSPLKEVEKGIKQWKKPAEIMHVNHDNESGPAPFDPGCEHWYRGRCSVYRETFVFTSKSSVTEEVQFRAVAPNHPLDVLQNWVGTEPKRTVTYMVLEVTANDRRTSSSLPRSWASIKHRQTGGIRKDNNTVVSNYRWRTIWW